MRSSGDVIVDRQMHKHTNRQGHHNTLLSQRAADILNLIW